MDIIVPSQTTEFNFNSTTSTPYASAPSSPKRFGEYYSAPTSPVHSSSIYHEFNRFSASSSVITFDWDESIEKPHLPNDSEDDFAFNFDLKSERSSLTADELFDGGKIRPLIPTTHSQLSYDSGYTKTPILSSPISSKSSISKKMSWEDEIRKEEDQNRGRGRGRTQVVFSSNSKRRESRSLSPFRIAEFAWEEEQKQQQQQQNPKLNSSKESRPTSDSSSSSSRRWRIRDLLLFRSASEGRASDNDPLRKYTNLSKKPMDDEKNSSFPPIGTDSRRKGPGLHYKVNKVVGDDSRKKTYLPYKPTLFGWIGFNHKA